MRDLLNFRRRRYGGGVPISRQPVAKVPPVRRPPALDGLEGKWVARVGDEVIAAADTSRELALVLHRLDHRKRDGAVVEYVRPSSDAFIVGLG